MSKIKLNALSPEEQLDILSRVYIREVTKPVNQWLSSAIRTAGGPYNTQLNMGKAKNMFLSGSIQADDYAYAVNNSKYETNRFSVTGAFYNYLYRSKLIDELRTNYNVDRGVARAYGYVRNYGYEPFYTYMRSAYLPVAPSSIVDMATTYGKTTQVGRILDEEVSTSTITLDDFSKEQIKLVKHHIKRTVFAQMKAEGYSTHDIEPMLEQIDKMRTTPYINKNKTGAPVKKPSKKLEGFLVGIPAATIMDNAPIPPVTVETQAKKVETPKTTATTEVKKSPVNEATGLTLEEELELMRELDESESVIISSTDAYDGSGMPLCRNQKGLYCYPDGSPFRGDTIYDEYGGIYEDLKEGLVYGARERQMMEEEEDSYFGNLVDEEEDNEIRVINGVKYDSKGHMISDGGLTISVEDGYTDDDEKTTRLDKDGPVPQQ